MKSFPSPAGADNSVLIDHALSLIARGELPLKPFSRVNAGFGRHELCRLCARPIDPSEVRYRVPHPQGLLVDAMTFHVQCYIAWETAAQLDPGIAP